MTQSLPQLFRGAWNARMLGAIWRAVGGLLLLLLLLTDAVAGDDLNEKTARQLASDNFAASRGCNSVVTFIGYQGCRLRECVVVATGCGRTSTLLVTKEYGAITIDGVEGLSLVGSRSASPHCPSLGSIAWALGSLLHMEGLALPQSWTAVNELVPDHVDHLPAGGAEFFKGLLDDALDSFEGHASGKLAQEAREPSFEYTIEARAVQWAPYGPRNTGFCVRVNSRGNGPLAYDCALGLEPGTGFGPSGGCGSCSTTFVQSRIPWIMRRLQ